LKFTTPANNNDSNTSGAWKGEFARLGNGNFFYVAPGSAFGQTIYIQFYAQFDSNFLTQSTSCTGGCYGIKYLIVYGNPPAGSDCCLISIVSVLYENGGSPTVNSNVPTMYGQQGYDTSYYTDGAKSGIQPERSNCTSSD